MPTITHIRNWGSEMTDCDEHVFSWYLYREVLENEIEKSITVPEDDLYRFG